MTLLRTVARPMLASMFLYGGTMALRNAPAMAPKAQPLADKLQKVIPSADAVTLTRVNAAVHVAAGLSLATGHFPRASALAIAATMPATTATGHQFWKETDPDARRNQTIHFMKNVSMTGGLLLSALDPDPHKKWIGARAKKKVAAAGHAIADQVDELRS
ncbi:DoxX family protein [uncultured Aeromicrobium sp.]|uniref:DoxX family protein n=1 Tax=uncultured Aeromicrobium sp. TaxID=337820 RepID=UPI0025E8D384|nr:DoxX family protein [uncultured Aeromicrobium sp.]